MFSVTLRSLSPCCGYINYNSTMATLPRHVYEIIAAEIEMLRCPLKSGLLSWERWSAGERLFPSHNEWVLAAITLPWFALFFFFLSLDSASQSEWE